MDKSLNFYFIASKQKRHLTLPSKQKKNSSMHKASRIYIGSEEEPHRNGCDMDNLPQYKHWWLLP